MNRRRFLFGITGLPLLSTLPAAKSAGPASFPTDVRMLADEGEAAKYWPRWRGPTGQGIALQKGFPDTWSDTENVLWKVEVPGRGNSSPIIWKDRLFLTSALDAGKRRGVLCFARDGGKLLWQAYAPDSTAEKTQGKNGYASGTPCTDGERVYAYFGNHGLFCVDFDGKQVWHVPLGPFDALHGTACSPLLYKDRIVVYQDTREPNGSFVAAYARKDGKQLWRIPRSGKVGWGSPVAIWAGDRDEIIVSSESRVTAYDPANGKQLWFCSGNLVEVTPTPVAGDGLLFCCSGRAGPTLAIHPGGSGDVTKTNVQWSTVRGSPFIPSPILVGDYLYMINDIGSVATCFEAKTGKVAWQERLGRPVKEGFSGSPVAADGKVYFTNDDGETFVLKAGPDFELVRVNKLNARVLASPALLDGRWYWRTDKQLLCVGKG